MTTFEILLQQIGLFVIYILAGVILVRTKVLNKETLEPISKFVIKMALPVMIFINIIDELNQIGIKIDMYRQEYRFTPAFAFIQAV